MRSRSSDKPNRAKPASAAGASTTGHAGDDSSSPARTAADTRAGRADRQARRWCRRCAATGWSAAVGAGRRPRTAPHRGSRREVAPGHPSDRTPTRWVRADIRCLLDDPGHHPRTVRATQRLARPCTRTGPAPPRARGRVPDDCLARLASRGEFSPLPGLTVAVDTACSCSAGRSVRHVTRKRDPPQWASDQRLLTVSAGQHTQSDKPTGRD